MRFEIPESFYLEEVRDGHTVSADMKKVWAAELELYGLFCDVCDRHGLRHFWTYGNLIGAARHKGYIPWDDDIDVFMPREDYKKLCEIASQEFTEPYFFQTEHTDPGCHITFAKIRKNGTTAILDFEAPSRYRYHQGIFLDIFPMDNLPDDPEERRKFGKKTRFLKRMSQVWARMFDSRRIYFGRKIMYLTVPFVYIARGIVHLFRIPNIPCLRLEKVMQTYNDRETEAVSVFCLGSSHVFLREWFADTVMLPFEFLEVPAPVGYVELLDKIYGNWHVPARGAAGRCAHEGMTYDMERPYTDYL